MAQNDYDQLARRFMDLWQKQWSHVASDKEFIEAMLKNFQSFTANSAKHGQRAAAPNAPDDDAGMLAELTFRLAMCERRLAVLEARPAAPKKSGRKRSAKPRK